MLSTGDVKAWLQAAPQSVTEMISVDGEVPAMPDRLVVLTMTGGPGTLRERTFDGVTLQMICRGAQNTPEDAEDFIAAVDALFMGAVPPVTMNGKRVISIDYSGGPPAHMDTDEARRRLYVVSYALQVARSVH